MQSSITCTVVLFPTRKLHAVFSLVFSHAWIFILILLRGIKHFHIRCTGFVKTSADFCASVATVLMINHLLLLEGGVSWVCHHARMLEQGHRLCSKWHDAYCILSSSLSTAHCILFKKIGKKRKTIRIMP